ncbi:MAG: hypothetical protein ACTS4V_00005 [Candidatus Hodgkinia cicadicola]
MKGNCLSAVSNLSLELNLRNAINLLTEGTFCVVVNTFVNITF